MVNAVSFGRELFGGAVLVLGDQVGVLEEVVAGAAQAVAAGLRHHLRDQAGRAGELRGDAAGRHLLFGDDFRVHVGAERARHRVGHVDAVEVIQVVGRHAERAANVVVVQARARGRVARRAGIVRQDARHELQVALIGAARRQGFGQTQGDVRAGGRAPHVDEGRGLGRDRHRFLDAGEGQRGADRQHLRDADQLVLAHLLLEALHRDLHGVELGGLEQLQHGLAGLVGHRHALRGGVDRARFDRRARERLSLRIGHEHFNRAGIDATCANAPDAIPIVIAAKATTLNILCISTVLLPGPGEDGRLRAARCRFSAALRCGLNNARK